MGEIVLDHDELRRRVDALRAQGKRIVFTNGGFDLLHVGHLRSLVAARTHGDALVVALNSDDSIRGNKGPGLPIVPLDERMELVAALGCVDLVTSFDAPRVDGLLLLLKPDVHAKGTDYRPEAIPERATVESFGGRIAIVGDAKVHSTSWLIDRIRKGTRP